MGPSRKGGRFFTKRRAHGRAASVTPMARNRLSLIVGRRKPSSWACALIATSVHLNRTEALPREPPASMKATSSRFFSSVQRCLGISSIPIGHEVKANPDRRLYHPVGVSGAVVGSQQKILISS